MSKRSATQTWIKQSLTVVALFCHVLATSFALAPAASAMAETTAQDFAKNYQTLSPLHRAAQSMQICRATLAKATSEYTAAILDMGQMYSHSPEAIDYLISKCNTMWTALELDPTKAAQIGRAQKIASLDLLEAGKAALPVKIRQYIEARPAATARPAPYEILTGLASNARELDQALQYNVTNAIAALAMTGGGLVVATLEATGTIARTSSAWGLRASAVGLEAALVVTVLSAGVAVSADFLVWYKKENNAWQRVQDVMTKLKNRTADQPLSPLLDEYFAATERLGYFYSYSLLQADNGKGMANVNAKCFAKLEKFFKGPANWAVKMERQTVCGDAAAIWAAASQWLQQKFPNEQLAQDVANKLMARSKRTYWSYIETQAYLETMPVCIPTASGSIFEPVYQCRDRKTGALVL